MKDNKYYYKDGTTSESCIDPRKLHRLDGPATEYADGSKYYYIDGKYHRIDGPAIEYANGSNYWYIDGKRHRLDGPAIEYADGGKSWYIDDQGYSKEEHRQIIEEARALSKALRLIDPRAWVREL